MEEKPKGKRSLLIFFLILVILVIVVISCFMYVKNKSLKEEIKSLEEKISDLQTTIEQNNNIQDNESENQSTPNDTEIKIVSDITNGQERLWPSIYIDENGYIYYNTTFNYVDNNEKTYQLICDQNENKIKPTAIIVQSPTVRNELDPNIITTYTFLTDSKVYQFTYYFDEKSNKEMFSEYAEIKYDISLSKYQFLEVKDQYGGHTIDVKLMSSDGKEEIITDIMLAYDVKTNSNLIFDSWNMDFEKEYDI